MSAEEGFLRSTMNVALQDREPAELGELSFPLLRLIIEARNEHGMRQHDWERYRRYCATKTKRVRSALHLTHAPNKPATKVRRTKRSRRLTTAEQSAKDKKRDHTFERRDIVLDQVADTRPLELLLFESEHAWAAAEELWAKQTEETRAKLRRSSLGRARRAMQYATKLNELADALPSLDVHSRAQCLAYVGLVRSASAFIQENWESTLRATASTRRLLTITSECSTSSRDEAVASSFLDTIDAQIRFATYSLGETEDAAERVCTPDVCEEVLPGFGQVTTALQAAHPASASSTEPFVLHWRSQTIPVHSLELHDAIQRVQAEEATLALHAAPTNKSTPGKRTKLSHAQRNANRRSGMGRTSGSYANRGELDPFDRVLAALTDAESIARVLVDDNTQALAKTHSTRYEAAGLQLRRAHEWLAYRLLSVRIARNVRLWEDVQSRAAKREARAEALMQQRTHRRAQPAMTSGKGKRAARQYARSGTHARSLARRTRHLRRVQSLCALQSDRRRQRIVPGIAKLLDSIDSCLLAMGGLELVEGEPDVSSLLETKRFYYCSELLRQVASAFAQHNQCAESLVLLQRADLYVRQAMQSLEFAQGAQDEDQHFAPQLLGSDDVLSRQTLRIQETREHTETRIRAQCGVASSAMQSTKGGQTLYYYAHRHVSLDEAYLTEALAQARPREQEHDSDVDAFEDAENETEDMDEEEDVYVDTEPAPAPSSKSSWLSRWLGR